MRAVFASFILLGLCFTSTFAVAQIQEDFVPMAEACDAFLAGGDFPDVSAEAAFFTQRGFKGAASSVDADSTSHTYTRSGTPLDPAQIMVGRPTPTGGEDCTVLSLSGSESGDAFLALIKSNSTWRSTGESNDDNGKGFLFQREAGGTVVNLTVWGTGATYPISVASYQIGTSD